MLLLVFSVYDSKAGAYLRPFFEVSKGTAMRAFMDACGDPNHNFAKHASDFTLFHLGSFDDQIGRFESFATPEPMVKASELLAKAS